MMGFSPPDPTRRKLAACLASFAAGGAIWPGVASAQDDYPSRPITFICPWPAGGTADATMRVLAGLLAMELKQQLSFKNLAGASGMLGALAIAKAKPDGYTIGQIPISVTRFALLDMLTFDPLKDFSYLARTSGQSFGIVVKAESPYKTLEQLLAAARANPGKLTYASAGIGGATHVGMEEFLMAAGIRMHHVPYKGGAPALSDLMGGQVDALADSPSWANEVKRGRLRLLATWGAKRLRAFPDVLTLTDLGFKVVVDAPNGIGGPQGLTAPVRSRLREALRRSVLHPRFKEACERIHAPVLYQDAHEYRRYVAAQYAHQASLIEKLNLRDQLRHL